MEEGCGSWFPQQHLNWQLHGSNKIWSPPLDGGKSIASVMKPNLETLLRHGQMPSDPLMWLPVSQVGLLNEPRKWFYCLPSVWQSYHIPKNLCFNQSRRIHAETTNRVASSPNDVTCGRKNLLVFDQSGDQTTLLFSRGIERPVDHSWLLKDGVGAVNLNNAIPDSKPETYLSLKLNVSQEDEIESEMHEDTEELNALLYSDDDSEYDEDEVNSTGRSPNACDGLIEEVASSDGSSKKRKLLTDCCIDVPSFDIHSKISPINSESTEWEDDAESKCVGNGCYDTEQANSGKKLKKERIRKTVSLLQDIIPGVKCDDPILVLDEAINYLKYLKNKAEACVSSLPTS